MAGSDGVFHADLHVHSRFSRACSKDCGVNSLAWWAARKGITVIGTGDFTHPAWVAELKECLAAAEPGLLRLRPDLESRLRRSLPPSCDQEVRFLLSAEISTIYKCDEATRKIHHLVYAPTFEAADSITAALSKVGNLASDGRPILGLDSRHLLEITLDGGSGCFLVPAHIWTPWFAVLGSKSGFDTVADCYRDLAEHVFAVETGLSSDPPMNWMCSVLDSYRLVSNSDAHSPPMVGREATTFSTELDYFAMAGALRTGRGLAGTVNFFPEGGRYHLDGHRKCGIRFEPAQTTTHGGVCPQCGKPLTIGVLHRVAEIADRAAGYRPSGAAESANLVSLPEIIGEISGRGRSSKSVTAEVDRLVAALGPELRILCEIDVADISRAGGALLGEAIARLRSGAVRKEAGYDGEYGVIRLFGRDELATAGALFDVPASNSMTTRAGDAKRLSRGEFPAVPDGGFVAGPRRGQWAAAEPAAAAVTPEEERTTGSLLAGLDPCQRAAAMAAGPLMIIAGPGTGKTRTLTHRIAAAVAEGGVPAQACLALTFTRRAAQEMRERLAALIPGHAGQVTVTTFHGLGLAILREHAQLAGLAPGFTVADENARLALSAELAGSRAGGRRMLARLARDPRQRGSFAQALAARGMVEFADLVELPVTLLREEPAVAAALRERWQRISVDEYQDIDASQYALVRLLSPGGDGLTVIGDPDQAIYGFRGADVGFFLRFRRDYPAAATVVLTRNYRSSRAIVAAAQAAVAPSTLVPGRALEAVADDARRQGAAAQGPGEANNRRASTAAQVPARITLHEAADEQAEGTWIAERIDKLLGGSSFHSLDTGRADGHYGGRVALADIAVLYRTDAQAGAIGQALTRAGLPFQKRTHDLLVRRTAVPEIIHQMRLAGPTAPACASPGALTAPGQPQEALRAAFPAGQHELLSHGGRKSVAGLLAAAVATLAGRDDGPAAVDVLSAGEVLAPLARRCGNDLEQFLAEIALGAETDALDPRADAVTLLTLHAAKGLEFSVVFLAGCERGLLPLWMPGVRRQARGSVAGGPAAGGPAAGGPAAGGSAAEGGSVAGGSAAGGSAAGGPAAGGPAAEGGADPAEERRLLFVGMTRARTFLFLTCAARRRWHGTTLRTGPSPFLAAIDPALLDRSRSGHPRRTAARQLRLL